MSAGQARIQGIYRYPVKGLTPEPLARTHLIVGATIAADRLYAIENGPSGFDPAAPAHLPKIKFLMLMRNERLARLRTRFDDETHVLTVKLDEREAARGDLRTAGGRATIERFFADYCADDLRGPPRVLQAAGHSFSDVARKVVSIINLASVEALEDAAGAPVHPLRFRGNLHVEGWPAWHEFDLVGQEIAIGSARLKVVKRIQRCAATNVDPDTGLRDLAIPDTLMRTYGHADCGIYAEVVGAGDIAAGDVLAQRPASRLPPGFRSSAIAGQRIGMNVPRLRRSSFSRSSREREAAALVMSIGPSSAGGRGGMESGTQTPR